MSDLVAFLRARLAEDEAAARAAAEGPWRIDEDGCCVVTDEHGVIAETHAGTLLPQEATVAHIARWDPVRVLAEVAAGRREIAIYEKTARLARQLGGDYLVAAEVARQMLLCRAQAFTRHQDFDQAWLLPEVDLG